MDSLSLLTNKSESRDFQSSKIALVYFVLRRTKLSRDVFLFKSLDNLNFSYTVNANVHFLYVNHDTYIRWFIGNL